MKTLDEQLQAARRELEMRKRVYPNWVARGKMTQAKADHETECMADIVNSLEALKDVTLKPNQGLSLLNELRAIVPKPGDELTWELGCEILNRLQKGLHL